MKMFAFYPRSHGPYSFFVMAESESEAREFVNIYSTTNQSKEDHVDLADIEKINDANAYAICVYDVGGVACNPNE